MWCELTDLKRQFEYENGFYLTAPVARFSKFVSHLDFFRQTLDIAGDVVECGVFKGASLSRFIKFRSLLSNCWSKRIIAFDIFGEFPEATFEADKALREKFVGAAGTRSISLEEMTALLDELGLNQNIELVKGDILETVPAYVAAHPELRISLIHVDVDLLEPTAACLQHLYPHVSRGGIVILDDYGAFPGANKAIDEFFADQRLQVKKLPFSNAISYVQKP